MTITLFRGPPAIDGDTPVLAFSEKQQYRLAALHARRAIPGPIGELVHRELTAYADFGYRFDTDGLVPRLAAVVLALRTDDGSTVAAPSGVTSLLAAGRIGRRPVT